MTISRRQPPAYPPPTSDRGGALVLCLLTALLWGAASVGPAAWAAPGRSPPAQTVPTVTPAPDQPSPPASQADEQEFSPPPTETPTSPPPSATTVATPAATTGAQPEAVTTATSTATAAPMPLTVTRQPTPTSARQTAQSSFAALAPPALPAPRVCAPSVAADPRVTLSPSYDQPTRSGLAWLVLLITGTVLISVGIVLIFRSGG